MDFGRHSKIFSQEIGEKYCEEKMVKKYGFSFTFSWKRLFGIGRLKRKVARKTGIPLTKSGVERKIGKTVIDMMFKEKKK